MELTKSSYIGNHIGVGCPVSVPNREIRDYITGPIYPYIGSKTSEDTSVMKTWEKELVNPLGRKAFDLVRCIDWFVDRDSKLSASISNNLSTVSGLEGLFIQKTSQRSGCPIHRFSVSRQSSGGFSSINPNNLRWMYVTAESWSYGTKENMDFMHQSAMLFAQCVIVSILEQDKYLPVYNKFKLRCDNCMRKIPSLKLDSNSVLRVIKGQSIRAITKMVSPDIKILTPYSLDDNNSVSISLAESNTHIKY